MSPRKIMQFDPLQKGPSLAQRASVSIPYREVSLSQIEPDPNQPRIDFDKSALKELSESIDRYGVLNPILVRPHGDGKFRIVAGERRYRAAKKAGLKEVPVILSKEKHSASEDVLALQLVENLQRSELKPLERAHALGVLKEAHGLSVREVATRVGISKSSVQRSLDLLDLPDDLINALRQGASESKILELSKVEDPDERAMLLESIDSMTRAEIRARREGPEEQKAGSTKKKSKAPELDPEDRRIIEEIQQALGMRVGMKRLGDNPSKGKLSIDFYSDQDLKELFRKLVS